MGYMLPAALCIYWIANTVFSLIQEVTLNKYFNKSLDREETEKEKAAREKRYAKYQKQKELMAQQQMNGGGRNDRKPQPKKKKQGGEEKHSGTNENGRVGQRPYACLLYTSAAESHQRAPAETHGFCTSFGGCKSCCLSPAEAGN